MTRMKITSKNKSYSMKDSPFYNLTKKKDLEKLLFSSLSELKILSENSQYNVFKLAQGEKQREIQAPKHQLNLVHTRIASLLVRIKPPSYLHSGIKRHSYITNAKAHIGGFPVLTMDVRKFYPSVSNKSIYNFFNIEMNTSEDVAGVLSGICCYEDHIPTGSRLSMCLAFWANIKMYSKIYALCKNKQIKMTVYVDDLTFSGNNVNRLFQKQIEEIIISCGFDFHPAKTRLYSRDSPKLITGVVVNHERILVRNKHHKSIYNLYSQFEKFNKSNIDKATVSRLTGMINSASQIDGSFNIKAIQLIKTG